MHSIVAGQSHLPLIGPCHLRCKVLEIGIRERIRPLVWHGCNTRTAAPVYVRCLNLFASVPSVNPPPQSSRKNKRHHQNAGQQPCHTCQESSPFQTIYLQLLSTLIC